jgi:hypothetical protein
MSDYVHLFMGLGIALILIILLSIVYKNDSSSLGSIQAQIADINQKVSTISTNVNTLLKNYDTMSVALNDFTTKSKQFYLSNEASIKSINDVISSLNAYSTSSLLTRNDLSALIAETNKRLNAVQVGQPLQPNKIIQIGSMGNRAMFSVNDNADQIAATVANIKQQLINQTLDYMQTSEQFSNYVQSQMATGLPNMQTVVSSVINNLIASGQITITTANVNDFNAATNKAISDAVAGLTSNNIPDFQTATLTSINTLAKSGQLSINASNVSDFTTTVNNLLTVSTLQKQLNSTQNQLNQLTLTVGNYIDALQGGKITISSQDIAKLYSIMPDNQTYSGNNIGGQCGTYSDLYSAYSACNVNSACVGFTTIVVPGSSGLPTQVPACLKNSLYGGIQTANPTSGVVEGAYKATGSLYQTYIKNDLATYNPESDITYDTPQNISCYTTPNTNNIMDAAAACNSNPACVGFNAKQDNQGIWRPNCLKGSLFYKSSTPGELFFSKSAVAASTAIPNTDSTGNEIRGVLPNIEVGCKDPSYAGLASKYTPQEAQFWCSVHPLCRGYSIINGRPGCFYSNVTSQTPATGTTLYTMQLNNELNNLYSTNVTSQNPFSNILVVGQSLSPGRFLVSSNGLYNFGVTSDGRIGSSTIGVQWIWITKTFGAGTLTLQTDGNLVYRSGTNVLWLSGTAGKPASYLVIQNDGNVVLYDTNNVQIWAVGPTATARKSFNTSGLSAFNPNTGTYAQGKIFNSATNQYLLYDTTRPYAAGTANSRQFGGLLTTTPDITRATTFTLNNTTGAITFGNNIVDDGGVSAAGDAQVYMYNGKSTPINNNQIFSYNPSTHTFQLKNKTNLCLDSGNTIWRYMGCATNENEFGSDKSFVGGTWGANHGQWKASDRNYVAAARTATGAYGFQWNNAPNITSWSNDKVCTSAVCADGSAYCGSGDGFGGTTSPRLWAVYQKVPGVASWTCGNNNNQKLQFIPLPSLN